MNFTHTYPAGNYFVYGRLSGGGAFEVELDQVTASATNFLGRFSGQARGWASYDWWPLVDATGQRAAVSLGGVSKLRVISGGGANANLFLLVPAIPAPAPVPLSAALNGANLVLSFPTASGYNYSVSYKDDAGAGTWTPLTMVAGDGSVKSVSTSAAAARRFYRLLIQ